MIGALQANGWEVTTNANGEITATSRQSVTAKLSYSGDRFDWKHKASPST